MKRAEFEAQIRRFMEDEPSAYFLSVDMNPKLLAELPEERVLNIGIREQMMVGMAIGLSRGGYYPICYGVGCQVVLRAAEQIRFAGLNGADMLIVGVGHGGHYQNDGPSHDSDVILPTLTTWGIRRAANVGKFDGVNYLAVE